MHLWVLAHHPGSPQRWGGLDDLDGAELAEVLEFKPTLLFLGGPPGDVRFALDTYAALISGGRLRRISMRLHACNFSLPQLSDQ